MKCLVILLLVFTIFLPSSLSENYLTERNAHYASSDDSTFGIIHQHDLNYAEVWGDENYLTQDNNQYAKGIDIDQNSMNKLLIVGDNNYAEQFNKADAPKESEPGVRNIIQAQWNILALIRDYNGDQTNSIIQSNYAHGINVATDAWVNQVQSNTATVLRTMNYLEQTNNADALTTVDTKDTNQVQKNLAILIGNSGQFTPPSPDEGPIIKIDEADFTLPDPKLCESGTC